VSVFLALGIQHAKRMRHIFICCYPAIYIIPHYLINGTIFEKRKLLNPKCVFRFSLQLLSKTFLILGRTERYLIKNVYRSSCKLPLFLSDLDKTWIFSKIFENFSHIKFYKNPSSGIRVVPCGQTYGRTDMTKLIVAFRNFLKALKNELTIFFP
jgi:hypothetical protein